MTNFPHIFNPIKIGSMTSKNRLMMSAMSINFGVDDKCHVTDQLTQYFVERAKGGVGMMLVGGGSVHPGGQELPDLPILYDDSCIPSLQRMVKAVKEACEYPICEYQKIDKSSLQADEPTIKEVKFGVQLMHGGRQSYLPQKVAPSPIPAPAVVKGEVRALEVGEIQELVECFGSATRRCKDAGFDFVEIHAAHGYLINQFMSPNSNIRQDQYGGTFENRTRFLFEIIADIQKKTGKTFPVGIRMNGRDYIKNGWELDDAVRLAPLLEKAGVAYLHVSGGVYGSTELTIPSMYSAHGCFVYMAEEVKKHVSIPVITVGRIKSPILAEEILRDGKADVVSMGRALLADPYLPIKAKQGRLSEIRPCIGCCLGCIHAVLAKEPGSCVANPDVGREYKLRDEHQKEQLLYSNSSEKNETTISGNLNNLSQIIINSSDKTSDAKQKILVVGAGPSGMAAARLFAIRGHKVLIVEKKQNSGGLLSLASKAPGRGELGDILEFFINELDRLKVEIIYGKPLDEQILKSFNPDKVVVATGSMPDMPMIKGLFQSKMEVITSVDIFEDSNSDYEKIVKNSKTQSKNGKVKANEVHEVENSTDSSHTDSSKKSKRVIVLGGGMTGLITADYIAAKGNEVYVLNRKKSYAEEMSANDRYYLRESLKKKGVVLYKNVVIDRFTADGVEFHISRNQGVDKGVDKGDAVIKQDANISANKRDTVLKENDKLSESLSNSLSIDGCDIVVISEKHISIREIKKFESMTNAEFHFIGDAKSPRHLMYCISEAEELARS